MANKAGFDRVGKIWHLWFRGVARSPHLESPPPVVAYFFASFTITVTNVLAPSRVAPSFTENS
jgi:hypothetical protein